MIKTIIEISLGILGGFYLGFLTCAMLMASKRADTGIDTMEIHNEDVPRL